MTKHFRPAALFLALAPAAARADQIIADDLIVDGRACIGTYCLNGESFGDEDLKIKGITPFLTFTDTSSAANFATNDWRILIGGPNEYDDEFFGIQDLDAGTTPFWVEAGAPTTALVLDQTGSLGMGTSQPEATLHVIQPNDPTLRLEQSGAGGSPAAVWDVRVAASALELRGGDGSGAPSMVMSLANDAPYASLLVADNGNVGMGAFAPAAPLEIARAESFVNLRLTANAAAPNTAADITFTDAGADGALRFNIVDADGPEFEVTAAGNLILSSPDSYNFFRLEATGAGTNTAADVTFTGGSLGTGEFRLNVVDSDGPEMRLNADGVLRVEGGFQVGGTGLDVPDYVLADDYALRSLSEVAAFIAENRHLPDVPSAAEVAAQGLDMTAMQMALLRKVEELTLYTLKLDDGRRDADRSQTQLARLVAAQARTIAVLEARLAAVEAR